MHAHTQGQPQFIGGSPLYPHQLVALNWMRRMWARGQHAIFADEMVRELICR